MASRRGKGGRRARPVAGRRTTGAGSGQPSGPKFESPYQPPPGYDDLGSQTSALAVRDNNSVTGTEVNPTSDGHFRHGVELAGETYRVRTPRPEALHAFTTAVSPHVKDARVKNNHIELFVRSHTHPEDFERIVFRMIDPEDNFTKEDLGSLMRSIMTLDTARPTVPSSRSR